MKQILQNLRNGETALAEVPAPHVSAGQIGVATKVSLMSAGTERMLVDFGKANLVNKARQQPDKVREALNKVKTDGVMATYSAIQNKLDQPLPLGYCNVGTITQIGANVAGYALGDRVVSNGHHAEMVSVPKNLCAKIPDNVSDEVAAFTVVGAIGLQGIRLADPKLGECVAVIGLGLIGLLTIQMLRAQGCRVLGIDPDAARREMAQQFGAETVQSASSDEVLSHASAFSRGAGMDAVIITASTKSNDPATIAAKMSRKRGRIVLVGVVGLELSRADFFEKELSFQVSCSYGPGRYDPLYERDGQDYPLGYVRWTEQRNFEAVLDLMASGSIDPAALISHHFDIANAVEAYELLLERTPSLGIVINYNRQGEDIQDRLVALNELSEGDANASRLSHTASLAFLGAGNYAGSVLIPAFKKAGAHLHILISSGGVSAANFGRKYGFDAAGTDTATAIDSDAIDTVVIGTRHDSHADLVLAALSSGKHVFCEKPLCLDQDQLHQISKSAKQRPHQKLMVGFNRRFAPLVQKCEELLQTTAQPKAFIMTVNAGAIPAEHWSQDRNIGGGRIIGEACHFIDLLRHLAGASIHSWSAHSLGNRDAGDSGEDKAVISLNFSDGSIGTIHYLANGHKSFPKERLEVFADGKILQLDNFRSLKAWGWKGFSKTSTSKQDKGQSHCAKAFVEAIKNEGPSPITLEEILEVSEVAIAVGEALRK